MSKAAFIVSAFVFCCAREALRNAKIVNSRTISFFNRYGLIPLK